MQRKQIEWEMSYHPLRAMAHMSAQNRDTCHQLTLSSTHSPALLISLILPLSLRMKSKKEKARTRESVKDGEEKIDQAYQGQQDQLGIKIKDLNHFTFYG